MKTIFIFHFSFFIFLFSFVNAQDTIHVPQDHPTIQQAIDATNNGDVVLVADGTYLENINFSGKAITLASHYIMDGDTNHINNTIIDGSQPANPNYGSTVTFITGEDSTSVLFGMTITGGSGMKDPVYGLRIGGGIVCYSATPKIVHNKIINNEVNDPLYACGGGVAIFRDNGEDWAILTDNVINYNQCIAGNGYASGGGMQIYGNALVVDNRISGNTCTSTLGRIFGCGLCHSDVNSPNDTLILTGNFIESNSGEAITIADGGGIYGTLSNYIISDNSIKNNSLHSDNSAFGGGLEFEAGVSVQLNGNTFVNNSLDCVSAYGGGFYMFQGSVIEIFENTFYSNSITTTASTWYGAGICCDQVGSVIITGNDFVNNGGPIAPVGAGGGLSILDAGEGSIYVSANYFSQNEAYNGGGIFERNCFNLRLINNVFKGNFAYRAGGVNMFHPISLSSSAVNNSRDSHPLVFNNTFTSNEASNDGGGLRFQGDLNAPEILNCIFWGNSAPTGNDIENTSVLPIAISYSDVETTSIVGSWTGENNIYADPLFKLFDPFCHLTSASPCIDNGVINLYTPNIDFDGDPRQYGGIDIGADEYYIPLPPNALDPLDIGPDYFEAIWEASDWAIGYFIDVSENESFTIFLPGYENLDVGNVTSYLVANLAPIPYYYRLRAYNFNGVSENSNVIMVLSVNTDELKTPCLKLKTQIYPNPAREIINVQFTVYNLQFVSVKIYDLWGREVAVVVDEKLPAGEHVVRYDLSHFPDGIYLIRLQTGEEAAVRKFMKVD